MNHQSQPLPNLGKKAQYFIWIYRELSPKICLDALGSHYGQHADELFKEIEKMIQEEQK